MLTILLLMLITEYTSYTQSHSAIYYRALELAMPLVLVGIARASGYKWAATKVASTYSELCSCRATKKVAKLARLTGTS